MRLTHVRKIGPYTLSDHIFIQPQKLPMSIRAKFELPTSIRFEDIMGFNSGAQMPG